MTRYYIMYSNFSKQKLNYNIITMLIITRRKMLQIYSFFHNLQSAFETYYPHLLSDNKVDIKGGGATIWFNDLYKIKKPIFEQVFDNTRSGLLFIHNDIIRFTDSNDQRKDFLNIDTYKFSSTIATPNNSELFGDNCQKCNESCINIEILFTIECGHTFHYRCLNIDPVMGYRCPKCGHQIEGSFEIEI